MGGINDCDVFNVQYYHLFLPEHPRNLFENLRGNSYSFQSESTIHTEWFMEERYEENIGIDFRHDFKWRLCPGGKRKALYY